MKKYTILTLFLLLLSLVEAKGQVGERRSVLSIGFNGGLCFNSLDFDPTIKQKQHMGPSLGFTMRYVCEKYFSTVCAIQAELNYADLGWKEDVMNSENLKIADTYSRDLHYIQLPLLARLSWGKEERGLMFFVLAGPQFGYYLTGTSHKSATWTLNASGNPDRPNNVYQQYTMNPDRKVDYGLTGGMGLEVNTAIGHFMMEGRYYYGLNDIYNNAKKDVFARSANMTIVAKITYLFDLFNHNNDKAIVTQSADE